MVYPRLTPLDLVGPWEVLSRLPGAEPHLVGTEAGPVTAERGLVLTATAAFGDARAYDVLVVPGGPGQREMMAHAELIDLLRAQAARAAWTCGVCTGALLLAQAGILTGRRATTHWQARSALAGFGVDVVDERFVFDGAVVTSAGVSAGIDMALALAARLAGEETARAIQLALEYDPAPPFDSGSPARADPALVARLRSATRPYLL